MAENKYVFPGVVVAIIIVFVGFIVYAVQNPAPDPRLKMTSRELVQLCTTETATKYHIHQHLTLILNKQEAEVPANIGIDNADCMHSIHTHDATGQIHVEAPVQKDFILGDFFFLWGKAFSKDQIGDLKVDSTHGLKMFINGQESSDFENLILKDKQDIVIDYYNLADGPDKLPPAFSFDAQAAA